ncbi:transposase [Streptomyces sp.]|uniref:transposase n=1 Tax=Streptomyces sp. TaxID=1931 RepID=UPI0025DFC3FD|nr:transposase [Streptomyces sp.]
MASQRKRNPNGAGTITKPLVTDTLGLVLAVLIAAANVHDTAGGKHLLDDLAAAHPSVTKVWADGGYQSSILNHGAGLGLPHDRVTS